MTDQLLVYGLWGGLWGMLLGMFYFGGLWLTIRKMAVVQKPQLLLLLSFLLRLTVAGCCIVLIARQNPFILPTLLLFFLLTRQVISRLLVRPSRGGMHAD